MERRAFTLIEMMVVIAIIAILIAIAFVAGQRVMAGGRSRLTADTIKVLDQSLESYIQEKGSNPPLFVEDHRAEDDPNYQDKYWLDSDYAVLDSTPISDPNDRYVINSVGLYMHATENVPGLSSIFQGLDPRIVKQWHDTSPLDQPPHATIYDGWGNPIRFVHPGFNGIWESPPRPAIPVPPPADFDSEGGTLSVASIPQFSLSSPKQLADGIRNVQIRRSAVTKSDHDKGVTFPGDSDGGVCPGGRPYFYSAGPDADPSTTVDNVYTITPQFETPE